MCPDRAHMMTVWRACLLRVTGIDGADGCLLIVMGSSCVYLQATCDGLHNHGVGQGLSTSCTKFDNCLRARA